MPHLIIDKEDHIIAVLAGRPQDGCQESGFTWDEVAEQVVTLLDDIHEEGFASGAFKVKDACHCHGNFLAFACGVSFSGGQRVRVHSLLPFEN